MSKWLCIGIIALASVMTYGSSLGNDFVAWDDDFLVYLNPLTQEFSFRNITGAFTSYDPELYIPLTILSYQIEHALFGFNPFWFHLDNLLLHIIAASLVLLVLERLGLKRMTAFLAALLFAVHPINTEAAVWISARKDLLSAVFGLSSVLSFMEWRSTDERRWRLVTCVTLLLALLSKPVAIVLPLAYLLIDWMASARKKTTSDHSLMNGGKLKSFLPFFSLSLLFLGIGLYGKTRNISALTLMETALVAGKSFAFAIWKFLVPFNLSPMYLQTDPISIALPQFWIPVAMSIVLIVLLALFARRRVGFYAHALFGLLWFVLFLFPSFSNFAKGDDVYFFSDRYIYFAQIGLLFALGGAWDALKNKANVTALKIAFIAVPLLSFSAWTAHAQSLLWKNSKTLYRDALVKNQSSAAMYYNLGILEQKNGDRDAARSFYEQALAIKPDDGRTLNNLAMLYKDEKNISKAIELLRRAATVDPTYPLSYNTLGSIYLEQGKTDDAIREFRTAIRLRETLAQPHINLASALGKQERYEEALEEYKRAFELAPQLLDDRPDIRSALENLP